jgi:hypothetical protein
MRVQLKNILQRETKNVSNSRCGDGSSSSSSSKAVAVVVAVVVVVTHTHSAVEWFYSQWKWRKNTYICNKYALQNAKLRIVDLINRYNLARV